MKITITDLHPPRGIPVSRTFEAADLIDTNISIFLPDLRAHRFLIEVRKLLVYSRYDAAFLPLDDRRLNQLEQQVGSVEIQACFPHRWNKTRPLSAEVVVKTVEQAMMQGLQELRFHVDWYPFSLTANALGVAYVSEERVALFMAPCRQRISSKSRQAVITIRNSSSRLPWVRKSPNGNA